MLAAVEEGRRDPHDLPQLPPGAGGDAGASSSSPRAGSGEIRHYRGTYLQDWIADPKFPLVWRLDKKKAGSGALGDIAAHSIDLARFLVGEITEVAGDLETFVKTTPAARQPEEEGPRDR